MKKIIAIAVLAATASTGLAEVIVTDSMDDLTGWSANANWSASAGVAETALATQFMTMQTGVAAPVNIGDYVSASVKQRISVGSVGLTNANQYATRIAIVGDATGGSGLAKAMWTRRDLDAVPGQIWGVGQSIVNDPNDWKFGGWNNISTIGLSATTDATSDWFTAEVTITKTGASAYDFTASYYNSSDALIFSDTIIGSDMGSLAGQSTWYLNMGTEYQFTTAADLTKMEVDSATLTSSIPEPASLGLVAVFGGAVLFLRRRLMI
ncbi:PEP-CTERM sorting domain-containing protein [Pontiellaceae bacterium B12227]|nr:PEP-CTERM sorting domain-containing protein [Pontiellaceae bacterium B12227]